MRRGVAYVLILSHEQSVTAICDEQNDALPEPDDDQIMVPIAVWCDP